MVNTCRTCGLADLRQNVCRVNGSAIEPDKDFCSKHNKNPVVCEYCNSLTLQPFFVQDGDNWHCICNNCRVKLSSCSFCQNANICSFETDPSDLPKMVQQQIRQGNQVMITTVKNPSRVAITCQNNCRCFNQDFGCMRQFNYCELMRHIYDEPNPVKEDAE